MIDNKIKKLVLQYFYKKIPNVLLPDHIANGLGLDIITVKDALKDLKNEGLVTEGAKSVNYPSRITYHLADEPKNYPFEEHIRIGSYNIPRLLDNDIARAEDTNQLIETMQKFTSALEEKFQVKLDNQLKRFYGNLVAIFGVFIAIFALIMTAVNISTAIPMPKDIMDALKISFTVFSPLLISLLIILGAIWLLGKTILSGK